MTAHMNHPFHMVEKSPWPLTSSLGAMLLASGLFVWFHMSDPLLLMIGLMSTIISSTLWWRDIIREGTLLGLHSAQVTSGLRWGMIMFITSEVLFFFSFFWAYFHSMLNTDFEVGADWPPAGIKPFNPLQIPLLNTVILLTSGVTVTWAHNAICAKMHSNSINSLALTIVLGLYFTALQGLEYYEAPFTIADSVFGSTFFVSTGFHGLHVIIGSTFLLVCWARLLQGHFSSSHHMGLEAAIWYWHFVDVVWLFLFLSIYWWGS